MSEHAPKILLIDMLDAVTAMLEYSNDLNYETYIQDRKTRDAIYRNIMVLGEAAYRLPTHFIQAYPEIEWQKMQAARNALVHGYDKIDDRIVWNIVQNVLPPLKQQLEDLKRKL